MNGLLPSDSFVEDTEKSLQSYNTINDYEI